jgi:hypothetical protein
MNPSTGTTSSQSAAFAAAPTTGPSPQQSSEFNEEDQTAAAVPQLRAADPDSKLPSIQLGETIRFEEMGPVIINTDGTTRRISNWDQLSEQEQKATWRRISKRNEQRRQILLEQQQQQENEANEKEEL